ncbi:MAG: penicillin-binding protein 2 [Pyrinomonadaceae bacterium]
MSNARRKSKKVNSRQQAFNRFMLIVAFLVLWIGGIGARLVYLQVNQHDWLRDKAENQRLEIKRSKMPRGTIYDRDGRVLAMSVTVKTLYADATQIADIAAAAKSVSKAAGLNHKELLKTLTDGKESDRKFVPLVRGISEEKAQEINKVLDTTGVKKADMPKFAGLHWRDEQTRSYPHASLAAHVIGFSNNDGVGQAGIEQSQNDLLYGAVIKRVQERDRLGRVYDEQVSEKEPPKDVMLTLSSSVQYKTEGPLAKAVQAAGAKAGIAIVIDQKTGEILAMANYPTFDPNKLGSITSDNLMNRAIQSVYSPGSAFKLVTYGAALEKHLFTPEQMIDKGNGTISVGGRVFKDHGSGGQVTYLKAMAQSSNVGAIKTALSVGKNDFAATVSKLGFGKATGIELPAETKGIVRDPARWNGDSLASMAIGYEIGVSALQMATAFATIANDGVRVKPHIIKEIRQFDEKVGSTPEPEKDQVVSVETARNMRRLLREVVVSGTAKLAAVDGYSIAGKTGTAWKFDEKTKRVSAAKYMSSFIGMIPADNPQVTIAVIIDEPRVGGRDGGQVAAPIFKEIAEQILPELNIKPDILSETMVAQNELEGYSEEPIGDVFGSPLSNDNKVADAPVAPRADTKTEAALPKKVTATEPKSKVEKKKEAPPPSKDAKVKQTVTERPRTVSNENPGTEVKRKT